MRRLVTEYELVISAKEAYKSARYISGPAFFEKVGRLTNIVHGMSNRFQESSDLFTLDIKDI